MTEEPFPREMGQITEALHQTEMAKMQRVIGEERRIRREIAELDARYREAGTPDPATAAMRGLGADMLWLGWVGRRKEDLNMRLANALVRKRQIAGGMALAFGRNAAVHEMLAAHDKARVDARTNARQARMLDAILSAPPPR